MRSDFAELLCCVFVLSVLLRPGPQGEVVCGCVLFICQLLCTYYNTTHIAPKNEIS